MKRITLTALLVLTGAPALAQSTPSLERATGQAVGLFLQACVPNTGDVASVRRWASDHQLGLIAPANAKVFLMGDYTGQVFGASNADGNYVLVSLDNGFCEVVAQTGDLKTADEFLKEFLKVDGYDVAPAKAIERQGVSQERFQLTKQARKLLVSVTQFESETPATPPQLRLTATPAP